MNFDKVKPIAVKPAQKGFDQTSLMLMGGVARSLQIAGSLETMLDVSVRYSNERVAFEKKISKFQAVQHNLAKLAGEAAAASASSAFAHRRPSAEASAGERPWPRKRPRRPGDCRAGHLRIGKRGDTKQD